MKASDVTDSIVNRHAGPFALALALVIASSCVAGDPPVSASAASRRQTDERHISRARGITAGYEYLTGGPIAFDWALGLKDGFDIGALQVFIPPNIADVESFTTELRRQRAHFNRRRLRRRPPQSS